MASNREQYASIAFDEESNPTAPLTEGYRHEPSAQSVYEPLEIIEDDGVVVHSKERKRSSLSMFAILILALVAMGALAQGKGRSSVPRKSEPALVDRVYWEDNIGDPEESQGGSIAFEGDGFAEPEDLSPANAVPEAEGDAAAETPVKKWDISMHPIAKDLAYYKEHANEFTRPYSLLMIQDADGYCLIGDDTSTEGIIHKHMSSFELVYKPCEWESERDENYHKVILSYMGTHTAFNENLSSRMEDSTQVLRQKILKYEVVIVVHEDEHLSDDTYILWQEGEATWQFRCDELPSKECISLAENHLKELEPDEFLKQLARGA